MEQEIKVFIKTGIITGIITGMFLHLLLQLLQLSCLGPQLCGNFERKGEKGELHLHACLPTIGMDQEHVFQDTCPVESSCLGNCSLDAWGRWE